jgi:ribosomal protein S18 acetylase RimI-like enzyme
VAGRRGHIRPARRNELEALRSIQRDARGAFAAIGMAEIAADEPPSLLELESRRAHGRAWVAIDAQDRPIAYLISSIVDGYAHIDQVSVLSEHARRGVGAALIEHLGNSAGRATAGADAHGFPRRSLKRSVLPALGTRGRGAA